MTPGMRRLVVDLNANAPVWALTPGAARRIRDGAPPGWDVVVIAEPTFSDGDGGGAPSAEVRAAIPDAEVYAGFGFSPALFREARRLRWVHSAAAGVRALLFPEIVASNVIVTNSAGVHAVPMAEYVVGGVLALLRGMDIAMARQREARWDRATFVGTASPVREARDCRVLIIGAGGIGSAVAQRLAALGAHCVGVRRHTDRGVPPGFERIVGPTAWPDLLPDTDVLVITAPATSETADLVSAERLDRLPRHAIVANVARGSLLDEDALAERVAAGRLRGAVLDVFATEPLPSSSPLWALPSVILTPHVSGVSPFGFAEREVDLLLDNWGRYVRGETMRNVVDKTLGY